MVELSISDSRGYPRFNASRILAWKNDPEFINDLKQYSSAIKIISFLHPHPLFFFAKRNLFHLVHYKQSSPFHHDSSPLPPPLFSSTVSFSVGMPLLSSLYQNGTVSYNYLVLIIRHQSHILPPYTTARCKFSLINDWMRKNIFFYFLKTHFIPPWRHLTSFVSISISYS